MLHIFFIKSYIKQKNFWYENINIWYGKMQLNTGVARTLDTNTRKTSISQATHFCQVKLIIMSAVVLAFVIVASGNDDVHSNHTQDEHVEHRRPHQLLWRQTSV